VKESAQFRLTIAPSIGWGRHEKVGKALEVSHSVWIISCLKELELGVLANLLVASLVTVANSCQMTDHAPETEAGQAIRCFCVSAPPTRVCSEGGGKLHGVWTFDSKRIPGDRRNGLALADALAG